MTLRQIQKEQREWAKYNFGKDQEGDSDCSLFGITEELGELAHAHLKLKQGIRGTPEALEAKAKDAVGDILIYMMDYCSCKGWDMQTVLEETWDEVKQRDWKKFPTNGRTE